VDIILFGGGEFWWGGRWRHCAQAVEKSEISTNVGGFRGHCFHGERLGASALPFWGLVEAEVR
jgi:hypothetical protein